MIPKESPYKVKYERPMVKTPTKPEKFLNKVEVVKEEN
eukprot:CAMPEP_0170568448 /NCGR_PEP_ID=MMETSP0211-20121228/81207_1 /TAXON_ID=311385 /ORGANISM="Pseudokeronopsis sp., Strain OXSARD2" /LENGTH=37 /DNA_ID= /DNA_START= /DNA_END= /DNA_ORIENTATION=